MKALIICHGDLPSEELLRREAAAADLVLSTDGVAVQLERLGIALDAVIGDLDSLQGAVTAAPLVDAGPHELQHDSDSEKAVCYALARGADEITLLGATGGRLDHTLANVALAVRYLGDARVRLVDDLGGMQVVRGRSELALPVGTRLSLVALTETVVVNTRGLQWELADPLAPGTRGLSNRVVASPVTIDVGAGTVVLITSHGTD